jgi:hypothetical protein
MARLSGESVTKSSLLPASAMMMFSLAWRWSSLTHAFALSSEAYLRQHLATSHMRNATHSLCDVVYNDSAVRVPIVHGRERLVSLLACRVPDLELDGCALIEGDGLGEESGTDGGFSVVVELIL